MVTEASHRFCNLCHSFGLLLSKFQSDKKATAALTHLDEGRIIIIIVFTR